YQPFPVVRTAAALPAPADPPAQLPPIATDRPVVKSVAPVRVPPAAANGFPPSAATAPATNTKSYLPAIPDAPPAAKTPVVAAPGAKPAGCPTFDCGPCVPKGPVCW